LPARAQVARGRFADAFDGTEAGGREHRREQLGVGFGAHATGQAILERARIAVETDQQQAARGASALIDNARWCGYVARMTEDEAKRLSDRAHDRQPIGDERRGYFVRFGVSKQNYDATPLDRWYMRHAGGVLVPVELYEASRNEERRDGRRRGDGF